MPRPGRQRPLVDGELLDRGLLECAAEAGERVAVVEVVEVAFVLARVAGDVEAGLGAGAGEGDVAPFLQACFAGAEDEGALDGEALGGVAGERVGVADVAGLEVAAAEFDGRAAVGGDGERPPFEVDVLDGSAGAVLDAENVGVAEADDAVAGGELAVRDGEPVVAEAAVGVHERAGELVEVGDVAPAEGEHDVAGEVVAGVLPPVGEQAGARRDRALGDDEPLALLGVGEVVAADAGADARERVAFELVALAAVLGQHDGAVALDDAGEEPARADGGELVRVADQDRLPVRLLDEVEHGREDARLGHAGLVDDEHASRAAGRRRVRASSSRRWSVVGGMPVSSWSFSAATPDGAAPMHRDARLREDLGDGVGGGRLAGAGESDDADDAARARRDLAHHRLLLGGEGDPVGALDLVEALLG